MSTEVETLMRGVKAESARKMKAYKLGIAPEVDEHVDDSFNLLPDFVNTYTRDILLGVIDGVTGQFNDDCKNGLKGSVVSTFNLATYGSTIYLPSSLIKTQMSVNDVMSAVNSVTAYCNFTLMLNQFGALL